MFKKYGRIKKRIFVVAAICLLLIILPVLFLFLYSSREVVSGNIADFTVGEMISKKPVHGLGLNMLDSNSENLILNNSFEPFVYRQNLLINSGDSETIKVAMPNDPGSGVYGDDFFIGAKANVLSIDSHGNRRLKKTGTVTKYLSDQIDNFKLINLPPDLPPNIHWYAIAESGNEIMISGDKGYVLSVDSFSESHLSKLPGDNPIVGVSTLDDQFIAIDQTGNVFLREQDADWHMLLQLDSCPVGEDIPLDTLVISALNPRLKDVQWHALVSRKNGEGNWSFMAVADQGYYIYGDKEKCVLNQLPVRETITTLTANADGYYLAGENSLAFYTKNGENFRYLDIPEQTDWLTISSRGKQILLAGKQGQVLFSEDGIHFTSINEQLRQMKLEALTRSLTDDNQIVLNPNYVSSAILSNDQLLLIDNGGLIYYSDDLGKNWRVADAQINQLSSPDWQRKNTEKTINYYNKIQRISSGHLIATSADGQISYALMGLNIELDSALEQGEYQNGDLLQLEQLKTEPVRTSELAADEKFLAEWFVSDKELGGVTLEESAPGGGNACFAIDLNKFSGADNSGLIGLYSNQNLPYGSSGQNFIMRQKIPASAKEIMNSHTFFVYEFWAKVEPDKAIDLTMSFDELTMELEPIQKKLSGDWQKYQGVLVMPENSLRQDMDSFINLSFSGKGTVYFDSFWFGPSEAAFRGVSEVFPGREKNGSVMRIAYNPIGNIHYASENWLKLNKTISFLYQTETDMRLAEQSNFVDSLEYCRTMNTNPWLIIDAQVSEAELRHLMQYLFGLENTAYGELRLQQGAISQYGNIFDQIYLEMVDTENILNNDIQRRAFVNWVIGIISEATEYDRVKNNLYFIDGMRYQENLFSSDADFHSSSVVIDAPFHGISELRDFSNAFYEIMPRDNGMGFEPRSELISSTKYDVDSIRLADLIAGSLSMLGMEKDTALLDVSYQDSAKEQRFADAFARIGTIIYKMNACQINSTLEQDKVIAFAYRDETQTAMIICNLSAETASCQASNLNIKNFSQLIYDADGNLLEEGKSNKNNKVFSLLPGSVIVLYGAEDGQ